MSNESSPARYHPAHVVLHWLIFLFVIMMLGVGEIALPGIPADDPQKAFMLWTHAYIGGFIAVLLVIRLMLRFTEKIPAAPMQAMPSSTSSPRRSISFYIFF